MSDRSCVERDALVTKTVNTASPNYLLTRNLKARGVIVSKPVRLINKNVKFYSILYFPTFFCIVPL